ncbi:ABC transporter permease subunit [bacterium]|nr:ABC transporter permease subunit [FCB group bacterium]MBL7191664.1 ABC transporter permease subunit [bacterium]
MGNILAIYKREMKSYFNSPIAYIIISLFLIISGYFYSISLFLLNEASMRNVMGIITLMFIFFIPAITMRTISEEKKTGTIELMLTMPIRESEIIIAKYLAALALLVIALVFTLAYVLTLSLLGNPDLGVIFSGYFGLIMMGGAYLALGVYASTITENQIVSFIVGFVIIFFFFMLDKILIFMPAAIAPILEYISIDYHFNNITRGVIDSRDVIYYLTVIVFSLALSSHTLASRKWT